MLSLIKPIGLRAVPRVAWASRGLADQAKVITVAQKQIEQWQGKGFFASLFDRTNANLISSRFQGEEYQKACAAQQDQAQVPLELLAGHDPEQVLQNTKGWLATVITGGSSDDKQRFFNRNELMVSAGRDAESMYVDFWSAVQRLGQQDLATLSLVLPQFSNDAIRFHAFWNCEFQAHLQSSGLQVIAFHPQLITTVSMTWDGIREGGRGVQPVRSPYPMLTFRKDLGGQGHSHGSQPTGPQKTAEAKAAAPVEPPKGSFKEVGGVKVYDARPKRRK